MIGKKKFRFIYCTYMKDLENMICRLNSVLTTKLSGYCIAFKHFGIIFFWQNKKAKEENNDRKRNGI
jgi:hypothetical protein